MTKAEIMAAFEKFIDDTLDDTIEESLAEQARIELETELRLQVSKKLNTSNTTTVGSNYLTPYTMPTDILVPAGQRIYVGNDPYVAIPFEDRMAYKDTNGFWYFDQLNGQFYLCGTQNLAQQITFPYITIGTPFQSANDSDTILKYPVGFHILIPMRMAQLYYPIDQGDKSRNWSPDWLAFYKQTKNNLIDWDMQWKMSNVGGSTPPSNALFPTEYKINNIPPGA
jgi:hypothetical protein